MENKIEFTRVNNDVNGNPRWVCHFLAVTNDKDREETRKESEIIFNTTGRHLPTHLLYELAIKKAKSIGGKRYDNKKFGGGIVFQSYNIHELERKILELKGK